MCSAFQYDVYVWCSMPEHLNRAPHTCLKIDASKAFGDWISDKQSMKSLAVTGIIGEIQRKGQQDIAVIKGSGFRS